MVTYRSRSPVRREESFYHQAGGSSKRSSSRGEAFVSAKARYSSKDSYSPSPHKEHIVYQEPRHQGSLERKKSSRKEDGSRTRYSSSGGSYGNSQKEYYG